MASYTDNIQTLSSFASYVQQLPVDAMVQVGMQKQAQYNEGVQRIQAQIDNVAGLDVVRDVDKQYLQSKLNDLGGKLKTVAAGDFSNFQLVNSVGGMVNHIAKDKNVLSAVDSTQRYKKQLSVLEEARKDGKSSPNREYDFSREVDSWMNGGVGQTFNGQFREHVDVNKKVLDVIGKLHPNVNIQDIPYAVNSNGTVNSKAIAEAMQRQGITEVNEGQIKTAVNSMLDENDLDELASQGRYNLREYSVEDLQNAARVNYLTTKETYKNKLADLKKQKTLTSDVNKQLNINAGIDYYTQLLGDDNNGTLDKSYQDIIKSIATNPDGARASLYTRNWLDGVANGFSYKEVKNEILSNPMREDMWKRLNYNLSVLKEQHDEAYRSKQLSLEERKLAAEEQKGAPYSPYWKNTGNMATNNLTSLQKWSDYNNSLESQNKAILSELSNKYSSINNKVSEADIIRKMETEGPSNDYEAQLFRQYKRNAKTLSTQQEIYKQKENEAYKELTGGKNAQELLNSKLQSIGDLQLNTPSGVVSFSPKEVYDYLNKEQRYTPPVAGAETILTIDDNQLTDRERVLKQIFAKRYEAPSRFKSRSVGNASVDSYINKILPVTQSTKEVHSKVLQLTADKMGAYTGEFKTQQSAVGFKNPQAKQNFISDIVNIASADLQEKSGDVKYDPKKVLSILRSKPSEDVDMSIVRQGDDYSIVLTDKANPEEIHTIKVNQDFVQNNPNLGEEYLNQSADFAQIMLSQGGTTNIFKDFDHAYYGTEDIGHYVNGKKTVSLPIVADLEQSGNNLYPVIKIKTKNNDWIEWKSFSSTDRYDFENHYLPNLTDEVIVELFKKTKNVDITDLIPR